MIKLRNMPHRFLGILFAFFFNFICLSMLVSAQGFYEESFTSLYEDETRVIVGVEKRQYGFPSQVALIVVEKNDFEGKVKIIQSAQESPGAKVLRLMRTAKDDEFMVLLQLQEAGLAAPELYRVNIKDSSWELVKTFSDCSHIEKVEKKNSAYGLYCESRSVAANEGPEKAMKWFWFGEEKEAMAPLK